MDIQHYLFVYDFAAIIIMVLLAFLSRGMGEALKIPPFFRILYGAAFLILCAFIIDTIRRNIALPLPLSFTMVLRCGAAIAALLACLRYWNWLFAEFIKLKGGRL
jgi:uncharacterized phage infection (PIP) family protein YhgE